METNAIYAPKAAAKISEAADLISRAAKLLDTAGDSFVIHEIERIEGTTYVATPMVNALRELADRLDS